MHAVYQHVSRRKTLLKNIATTPIGNPTDAFINFQVGLSRALRVSKEELEKRVAQDDAARTADRVQRGYAKRGPKKGSR
jgi:hypothetical protein